MARVTCRTATRADLAKVVAMLADDVLGQKREIVSEPLDARYIAGFEAIEASPNDRLVVAERDGEVVGCLQLTFLPGVSHLGGWRGHIEGVRVASGQRGGGVGRQMMEWAVAQCREKGCMNVQLTTNAVRTDARRFYESLGFSPGHVGMKMALG